MVGLSHLQTSASKSSPTRQLKPAGTLVALLFCMGAEIGTGFGLEIGPGFGLSVQVIKSSVKGESMPFLLNSSRSYLSSYLELFNPVMLDINSESGLQIKVPIGC